MVIFPYIFNVQSHSETVIQPFCYFCHPMKQCQEYLGIYLQKAIPEGTPVCC